MNKFKLVTASVLLSAVMFVSCDKEVDTTKTVIDVNNTERMATITVKGYANLDDTKFGNELVPDSSGVLLTAAKGDFIDGADGTLTYSMTFVNGVLVAEVPATEDGATYTVTPLDFEYQMKTNPIEYDVNTLAKRYEGASIDVVVKIGESKMKKVTYSSTSAGIAYVEYVKLSGRIVGEFDVEEFGNENYEDDATLEFYNADKSWYMSINTNGDGEFEVSVPIDESISCDYRFVTDKNISDGVGGYDKEDFLYEGSFGFGNVSSEKEMDVNVHGGEIVED